MKSYMLKHVGFVLTLCISAFSLPSYAQDPANFVGKRLFQREGKRSEFRNITAGMIDSIKDQLDPTSPDVIEHAGKKRREEDLKPAVIINGTLITKRDLRFHTSRRVALLRNAGKFSTSQNSTKINKDILKWLVRREHLYQLAVSRGFKLTEDEFLGYWNHIKNSLGMAETDEIKYRAFLEESGIEVANVESHVRKEGAIEKLALDVKSRLKAAFDAKSEGDAEIRVKNEKRLQRFFLDHLETGEYDHILKRPERVEVSHILFRARSINTREFILNEAAIAALGKSGKSDRMKKRKKFRDELVEENAAAYRKAMEAAKLLAGDAGFEKIAMAMSEDVFTASRGGYVGFIERGVAFPAFETAAFNLEEMAVSLPILTPMGYHLIKVHKKKPHKTRTFAEARDLIQELFLKQDVVAALDWYREEQAKAASVVWP